MVLSLKELTLSQRAHRGHDQRGCALDAKNSCFEVKTIIGAGHQDSAIREPIGGR